MNLSFTLIEKTKHLAVNAVILVKQIKGNTIIKVVTSRHSAQRKVARSSDPLQQLVL